MRYAKALGLAIWMCVALTLFFSPVAQAVTVEVDTLSTWTKTYTNLETGDIISWTWSTIGGGDLSFWIEDEVGTMFESVVDQTFDGGSFSVPADGQYSAKWYNDDINDPVTLDYDVSVSKVNPEGLFGGILLILAVVAVIIIVVVIVVVVVVVKRMKPREPGQQYPPGE